MNFCFQGNTKHVHETKLLLITDFKRTSFLSPHLEMSLSNSNNFPFPFVRDFVSKTTKISTDKTELTVE